MADDKSLVAEQHQSLISMYGMGALAGLIRDDPDAWPQPDDLVARLNQAERDALQSATEKLLTILEGMNGAD